MAEEFHFEQAYAEATFVLQEVIDGCRDSLHRYASLPSANQQLIRRKSEIIDSLDLVMGVLLDVTRGMPLGVFEPTKRFLRQLQEDPQLTEGIIRFRKGTGAAAKAQPLFLTIETNQINSDQCTSL